ncbi:hypothetical protein LINPERPRIM_LOCUS34149 [Linum perenne]
MLMALLTS